MLVPETPSRNRLGRGKGGISHASLAYSMKACLSLFQFTFDSTSVQRRADVTVETITPLLDCVSALRWLPVVPEMLLSGMV